MNNIAIALDGAWRVLLAGLLLGAGIPSLFAIAVNGLAMASGGEAAQGNPPKPVGKVIAVAVLLLILLLVVYGLAWLIFTSLGYKVGFSGILPTFTK
jgi:hypothetical protein